MYEPTDEMVLNILECVFEETINDFRDYWETCKKCITSTHQKSRPQATDIVEPNRVVFTNTKHYRFPRAPPKLSMIISDI